MVSDYVEDAQERYLHGECNVFAVAYREMFGGQIMAVKDEDGNLIHAWVRINGVDVDVRGVISDISTYLYDEFGDWWEPRNGNDPESIDEVQALTLGGHGRNKVDEAALFIKSMLVKVSSEAKL